MDFGLLNILSIHELRSSHLQVILRDISWKKELRKPALD